MPALKLKPGNRPRVLRGHPWVYATEVQKPLASKYDGEVLECRDAEGYLLGSGLYNSRSQILWRRFSRTKEEMDDRMLERLIKAAVERRGLDAQLARLVWSDSDFLPGLIVDRYGEYLVVQFLTLGMQKREEAVIGCLQSLLRPRGIILRNDAPIRRYEGLESEVRIAVGSEPEPFWIRVGEVEMRLDLSSGQKTGLYLDQRQEYAPVARLCEGKRVLDCFCNQGGFALHACKHGAAKVLGVDLSQDALAAAQENARRGGFRAELRKENAFDFLSSKKLGEWDVVVLDPPPFAKSKAKVADAMRGYKELNLRALKSLSKGGILATYTCSHHVGMEPFMQLVGEAIADAKRDARILRRCFQPEDHPVLPCFPESQYLHGLVLEVW